MKLKYKNSLKLTLHLCTYRTDCLISDVQCFDCLRGRFVSWKANLFAERVDPMPLPPYVVRMTTLGFVFSPLCCVRPVYDPTTVSLQQFRCS
jgi:hypothetical protein